MPVDTVTKVIPMTTHGGERVAVSVEVEFDTDSLTLTGEGIVRLSKPGNEVIATEWHRFDFSPGHIRAMLEVEDD